LGVKGSSGDGLDQINGTEVLHIQFSQAVDLIGVLTLVSSHRTPFFTANSGTSGPGGTAEAAAAAAYNVGSLSINGTLYSFNSVNADGLNLIGTDFYFAIDGGVDLPVSYYVSGLVWNPATTPVPAALPLFATGLGAMGLLGLRKKRKAQAAA
jgi:hypothetical protein